MSDLQIAVVTSGRGSLLRALLDSVQDRRLNGAIVAVVSNMKCPALEVARDNGVPHVAMFDSNEFASLGERDAAMAAAIATAGADIVIAGGYSDLLEPAFLACFPDRVISPYPSLLPAFADLPEAIQPALDRGVRYIGVTVHFATALTVGVGPIIAQQPIEVKSDDTFEDVLPAIATTEARLMVEVLNAFAADGVERQGRKVKVS